MGIILASGSPRRKEMLENLGIQFVVNKSDLEEKTRTDESPQQITMSLAFEKAIDVSDRVQDMDIVIAADTIVFKDKVMGKPKDYQEAFDTLKDLSGDIHYVYTGIAVVQKGTNKKFVTYEKTKVCIKELSDQRIESYINTGEVWDKAGSYGIQGYGALLIDWIEGDYFNVVGLPISKLDEMLNAHFNISIL